MPSVAAAPRYEPCRYAAERAAYAIWRTRRHDGHAKTRYRRVRRHPCRAEAVLMLAHASRRASAMSRHVVAALRSRDKIAAAMPPPFAVDQIYASDAAAYAVMQRTRAMLVAATALILTMSHAASNAKVIPQEAA